MIKIYTDGAASGNPGPGGYGVVLKFNSHYKELSGGYRLTTNNRMELMAVIKGLEELKSNNIPLTIYSDSKYVVDSVEKGWLWSWQKIGFKKKANADLWQMFIPLYNTYQPKFQWIKGHAGHQENERCDQLAVAAYQSGLLLEDKGYKPEIKEGLF